MPSSSSFCRWLSRGELGEDGGYVPCMRHACAICRLVYAPRSCFVRVDPFDYITISAENVASSILAVGLSPLTLRSNILTAGKYRPCTCIALLSVGVLLITPVQAVQSTTSTSTHTRTASTTGTRSTTASPSSTPTPSQTSSPSVSAAVPPWQESGRDGAHTGRSPFAGPLLGNSRWTSFPGIGPFSGTSPAIGANGDVYIGNEDTFMYVLEGATGAIRHSLPTAGAVYTTPTLSRNSDTVYSCSGNNVTAFSTLSGEVIWYVELGSNVAASPVLSDDGHLLFVGTGNGEVLSLDVGNSGAQVWMYNTGATIYNALALANGAIFAPLLAGSNYSLVAIDAGVGALLWEAPTGNEVRSAPAVDVRKGTVYLGSDDYNVYAFNVTDGAVLWTFATFGGVDSTPSIAHDGAVVYVGSNDGNLYALSAVDGSLVWSYTNPTGASVQASPIIGGDGTIYVGSTDGQFYGVDGVAGTLLWSVTLGGTPTTAALAATDKTVIVAASDGGVYAYWDGPATSSRSMSSSTSPSPSTSSSATVSSSSSSSASATLSLG